MGERSGGEPFRMQGIGGESDGERWMRASEGDVQLLI